MIEATKSVPAPLDAFESAKPDEPIWTVQGGDPLGAPLLRIWAHFARIQAGRLPSVFPDDPEAQGVLDTLFEQILRAANKHKPDKESECEELLIRASQTEDISFNMDEYLRGDKTEQEVVKKSAMQRMDIYDTRRRCAQRISSFFSELNDFREELGRLGFMFEQLDYAMYESVEQLKIIQRIVDVKRET